MHALIYLCNPWQRFWWQRSHKNILLNVESLHFPEKKINVLFLYFWYAFIIVSVDFGLGVIQYCTRAPQTLSTQSLISPIILSCYVSIYLSNLWLTVFLGPPGPPVDCQVTKMTETTASLSWGPGTDNHSPILSYTIQARTPFSLGWQAVTTGVLI